MGKRKRERQAWQCGRKVRFTSKDRAQRRAQEINARDGKMLVAYGCPYCGGAHLGHTRGFREDEA